MDKDVLEVVVGGVIVIVLFVAVLYRCIKNDND